MSNITLNIVEPSSPTPAPVDPGTNPAVPNTGLFTHGIGGPEATIILGAVLILAIVSIVLAAYMYRRHKKAGKATKLVHIIDQCKEIVASKKRVTAGLAAIALLVSAGTFVALARNGANATDAEPQAEGEDSLTVDVSDTNFTIEVGDEPVFAVLPVELTVAEATEAGYTLTAYAEDTDLVSTTDPSSTISMITVDEGELAALTDNTYGLSLVEPEDKDEEVYTALSTDSSTPTFITDKDYSATAENDTTTIYYGFYITPDVPKGTYEGSSIYYEAEPNYITTLTFNGNGSDGGEAMEEQTIPAGDTITLPQNTYTRTGSVFANWNTVETPTVEDPGTEYEDKASFTAPNESADITLYAQWAYTTIITFNGNGETSGSMSDQVIVAGTPQNLTPNAFAKDGYVFNGWNTVQTPTTENPGTTYTDKAQYTASTTQPESITLYAQWVLPLTFTAGDHIDTLMVADGSNKYKPFYVTPTSTDRSIVFTAPAEGTKYIITVVPEAGYVLSSDSANSSYEVAFSTGTLASNTLLTTTYTAGSAGDSITISAAQAGSDSAHSAYTTMQSLTAAQCPAYTDSAQGINVTDSRDNKSYTVAKFGNYCYMLSNLHLDGGTELDASSSHVSSSYTLPVDTGSGGWTNDYCQPRMASTNGEYYYNWPAATARTNSTSGTKNCPNDTSNSVGDICPAGWSLPTYNDITPATLWNSGANPGMLSTAGFFHSGSQDYVGLYGYWWSSTRSSHSSAYYLDSSGANARRDYSAKNNGFSVRCMRSS